MSKRFENTAFWGEKAEKCKISISYIFVKGGIPLRQKCLFPEPGSIVAKSDDRVEACGPDGGIDAKDYANGH